MIQAILNSKLYKNSSRKEKILAAINNPINSELVQQLSQYLDEDDVEKYVEPDFEDKNTSEQVEKPDDSLSDDNIVNDNDENHIKEGYNDAVLDEVPSSEELTNTSDTTVSEESSLSEPEDSSVESATNTSNINPKPSVETVLCDNKMYTEHMPVPIVVVPNEIKGLLNSRKDTTGVDRVMVKNWEVWVYYNDSINLNDIMSNVIELLSNSYHVELEFNRLARSDNAVVFDIIQGRTNDI